MHSNIIAGLALLALGASGGNAIAQPAPQPEPLQQTDYLRAAPQQEGYAQDRYQDDDYQDDYRGRDGYAQRGPGVRVWLDNDRDIFRAGDRSRVLVRASRDAFVAVLHINPRGDVEVLYPRSYYDDGFVGGGRTLSVGPRGGSYLNVGGVYGIGYVFAVASEEPLDLRGMRDYYDRRTVGFDRDLNVYGDPFYAMERFERMMVADYDYGYHSSDYYSYHVGSRYQYPRYACYSGFGAWYAGVGVYYDSCDRVRVLLRTRPHYYDTRYYRGDRSYYYRRYYGYDDRRYYTARRSVDRSREPSHRYKEDTDERSSAAGRPSSQRPGLRSGDAPPARSGSAAARAREQEQERERQEGVRAAPPTRQRPTLQRRPPESEPARGQPEERRAPPERRESPPARSAEPRRESPRAEPRREEPRSREAPPARSSEPRRESPPARSEPRRESPPSRSADPPRRESPPSRDDGGGRSAPSERSEPRVRPSL